MPLSQKPSVAGPLTLGAIVIVSALRVFAAATIDGRSAARWEPQPGWTPGRAASHHSVRDSDGWLEFSVPAEPDRQMTWTLRPAPEELGHEPRFFVFTYRAEGLSTEHGSYLLVFQDGSPSWRQCLTRDRMVCDGAEHAIAVDVLSYSPPEPIGRFALRIGPAETDPGRLRVKIRFADAPPAGASVVTHPPVETRQVRIEAESIRWQPSANWTPRPPEQHGMEPTPVGVTFSMQGQNRSMRWSTGAPEGVDIGAMPFATQPGDVDGDGRWHVFHKRLSGEGTASSMAVGIDALSPNATFELDYIEFSSMPPKTPVKEMLSHTPRAESDDMGPFEAVALPAPAGPTNPFMVSRLGIGDWFGTTRIEVDGVPFDVPPEPSGMLTTGTVGEDTLSIPLPEAAHEVLMLLAADFPVSEPFGTNWKTGTPLRMLSEPERMTVELTYADRGSDHMLPLHVTRDEYGVGHGIAVYAVHPTPGREPVALRVHDGMRNASFGVLAVTANKEGARFQPPGTAKVWYPPVAKPTASDARLVYAMSSGVAWSGIESDMLRGTVELDGAPVFSLRIGDRDLSSSEWDLVGADESGGSLRASLAFREDALSLDAVFGSTRVDRSSALLTLQLRNTGDEPVTGTLFFPQMHGVALGSTEQTWTFCARRGGVVSPAPCNWRDEIGEGHPLQVDGFFNPELGAGICFMPRDPDEVFRWYRVAKDEVGCHYSLEFLPQTVEPGGAWTSVPVLVSVLPGDWRDQFRAYRTWLRTWYKPLAPRKQWFRETFAFGPGNPTSVMSRPVEERLDLVAKTERLRSTIGACDYMHLFGWAKTEKYGHWGDYAHYDAVGGKDFFAERVRRCQDTGVPVGLYLDGYLVATKSQKPTQEQRQRWAVRKRDGEMLYHESYDAHSMCPYVAEWRAYLTEAYRRVAAEVEPNGMYIDEFGKCMTSRTCYATDHGHPSPMGMSPGERILSGQIREALPDSIATYAEYVPADVTSQVMDGAFGHVPLYGWRSGYDAVAPHYVNLHRFAMPDFKIFELIYYVPQQNGNWFLLKYPFFNGDGYYLTGSCLQSDEHARAFYRRAFALLHEHRDAFTSLDVEPLVPTRLPHVFANRFSTAGKTVWTLFNANHRTVRGVLFSVPHRAGATYRDAWNGRVLAVEATDGVAEIAIDIGPRAVGCIVQRREEDR